MLEPDRWTCSATGAFTGQVDLRGLLAVEHPWVPSFGGGFGQWSAEAAAPEGWRPGFRDSRRALDLLAKLAAGLSAEIRPVPGRFRYSPFPENNAVPHTSAFNALIGGLAGYLWHATGEARYRKWAVKCHDGIVDDGSDRPTSMDMHQIAGWMARAVAAAARPRAVSVPSG